jgi:ABC-type multidrug transport system fused ATPase/permease subunit
MATDPLTIPERNGAVKTAAGYFAFILAGSLVAAVLGGGFGALVAVISPSFVDGLFSLKPEDGSVIRYAFSMGMIWGLFIGVAVSGFACLLTTLVRIFRWRADHSKAGDA